MQNDTLEERDRNNTLNLVCSFDNPLAKYSCSAVLQARTRSLLLQGNKLRESKVKGEGKNEVSCKACIFSWL